MPVLVFHAIVTGNALQCPIYIWPYLVIYGHQAICNEYRQVRYPELQNVTDIQIVSMRDMTMRLTMMILMMLTIQLGRGWNENVLRRRLLFTRRWKKQLARWRWCRWSWWWWWWRWSFNWDEGGDDGHHSIGMRGSPLGDVLRKRLLFTLGWKKQLARYDDLPKNLPSCHLGKQLEIYFFININQNLYSNWRQIMWVVIHPLSAQKVASNMPVVLTIIVLLYVTCFGEALQPLYSRSLG